MFTRPVFPSPVAARMERAALGLSPELRTPPTRSRTTHVGVGTGHRARTWNYTLNITSVDPPIGVTTFRTCELQPGWVPLYTPGTTVLTPTEATTGRAPAASQRPVPGPRSGVPSRGALHDEASTRVQAIHPSDFPLACGRPDGTGRPRALPLGFATRSRTTHARVGTGHRARTWDYTLNSHQSISNPVVHSLCATSVARRHSSSPGLTARDRESARPRDAWFRPQGSGLTGEASRVLRCSANSRHLSGKLLIQGKG